MGNLWMSVEAVIGMGELAESQALDTIVNGSGRGMRKLCTLFEARSFKTLKN
jgi:hypothetical protein